jgi:hypothetical protein
MIDVLIGFVGVMLVLCLLVVILAGLILRRHDRWAGQGTLITFLVALAVAFLFQVSTPKLLEELSTDRDAQAETLKFSVAHFTKENDIGVLVVDEHKVIATAVKKFQTAHEDIKAIQGFTGQGRTGRWYNAYQMADQIKLATTSHDEVLAKSLATEFRELAAEERHASDRELRKYRAARKEALTRIQIGVWNRGLAFYVESPSTTKQKNAIKRILTLDFPFMNLQVANILGTLVTALLLSFTARRFGVSP